MVNEEIKQFMAQIEKIEERLGLTAWRDMRGYYLEQICCVTEKLKAMRESRDKWKKLSMCSRCHKIIEEKRG